MYLRDKDYLKTIQSDQLAQVIGTDTSVRAAAELAAQEEIFGYLSKRYDISKEFLPMGTWDTTTTYKARYRVQLDAPAYIPATAYTAASKVQVSINGLVYLCITNTTGAFDVTKWKLVGTQYDIWNIGLPYPEFNLKGIYTKGDKVFWKDFIYLALTDTGVIDHELALQFEQTYRIPFSNVFPDQKLGNVQWQKGAAYLVTNLYPLDVNTNYTTWSSVTAYVATNRVDYLGGIWEAITSSTNVLPDSDISKWKLVAWTLGDNRSQMMVMSYVDMALYHLHSKVSPRNIPPLRCERYDAAMKWLDAISKGTVTANLVDLQPSQGRRIRIGSEVKNTNSY